MRRSFYILIGSLVLCTLGLVLEKTNQMEPASEAASKPFGHYVHIDLDPSDPNLFWGCSRGFLNSKQNGESIPYQVAHTKRNPFMCNHPLTEDVDFDALTK
ncbi:MAG: hypothetical protein NTX72_05230 [Candidatus Uhrbacteria bacterium]|nr:hypothetical protein [Candidatus Uhrbacteria bacterium]